MATTQVTSGLTALTTPALNTSTTAAATTAFVMDNVTAFGSITGAINLDSTANRYFSVTVTGTSTVAITNPPASGVVGTYTLAMTNGGASTITWTNGKWAGGTAPALTTAGLDILTGFTADGGTTVRWALAMKDSK